MSTLGWASKKTDPYPYAISLSCINWMPCATNYCIRSVPYTGKGSPYLTYLGDEYDELLQGSDP
jgi:hypothetical protein